MRRLCFLVRLLTLVSFMPTLLLAQHQDLSTRAPALFWQATVTRDPQALQAIARSLEALGGVSNIRQIRSIDVSGHSTVDPTQQFQWQTSGQEFRMLVQSVGNTEEVNSGRGHPFRHSHGSVTRIADYVAHSMFVPAAAGPTLLSIYSNPMYSAVYGGTDTFGGDAVIIIKTALRVTLPDSTATEQTWYFSAASSLPVRVVSRLFDEHQWLRFVEAAYDLSNYQATQGVQFPQLVISSVNGKQRGSVTITLVEINPQLPQALFTLPTGGAE